MDKVKKMSNKECLKELNRISQLKKPLGKQYIKQKEKIKPDYNIFEKPKKLSFWQNIKLVLGVS
jgi:hypothetical protein